MARASGKGHANAVQVLLDAGARIESKNEDGFSPLATAASNGHEPATRLLLEAGANIESKTKKVLRHLPRQL